LIGRGARIGTAGPAVVRNCAVGRGVDLGSGFFEDSVFLDGAVFGPGGQARAGTLFEEGARAAHTVGTKHTILLPFVTLGSLINFCDCLMAGGTAESDHGEVGSGFIHFNFTPAGDKATPSSFGEIPRGVFLREPRIFLGGHAGVVGPARIGFGSVLAAGSVFRKDYPEGTVVLGEPARAGTRAAAGGIRGARAKAAKNFAYLGELAALLAFHRVVRARLAGDDAHQSALVAAAAALLADSMGERVKQLERFASMVSRQAAGAGGDAEWERAFAPSLARVRGRLGADAVRESAGSADRDVLAATIPAGGAGYLAWVRGLSGEQAAAGVRWLEAVRDAHLDAPREAGLV
jgi:UDP-N-acetylglucosamine/UDP-N-acetylgalactosamine diphosphorylase